MNNLLFWETHVHKFNLALLLCSFSAFVCVYDFIFSFFQFATMYILYLKWNWSDGVRLIPFILLIYLFIFRCFCLHLKVNFWNLWKMNFEIRRFQLMTIIHNIIFLALVRETIFLAVWFIFALVFLNILSCIAVFCYALSRFIFTLF